VQKGKIAKSENKERYTKKTLKNRSKRKHNTKNRNKNRVYRKSRRKL
jgi:hypothetical protein